MKLTSRSMICGVFAVLLLAFPLALHSQTFQTEQIPEEEVIYSPIAVDKCASFGEDFRDVFEAVTVNLHYPESALKNGTGGSTRVRFVIEKDGSISEVTASDYIDNELVAEAMRAVKMMPKWNPAILYDKPVRSYDEITIEFCVNEDDHSDYCMHVEHGELSCTIYPDGIGIMQIAIVDADKVGDYVGDKNNKCENSNSGDDYMSKKRELLKIFSIVETRASFPGGDVALYSFLQRNLRYPEQAQIHDIQGRVVVRFVVNRDGTIEQVCIAKGVSEELDQEAVRVIKLMPKWEPGLNNGTPVRSYFSLPITFRLTRDEIPQHPAQ